VEKVFKICLWIFKKKIQKDTFPCLLIWEWAKHFQVWNCSSNDVWNLMLSKINQLHRIIFIRILILVYNMDIVFSCRCRSWIGEKRVILIREKKGNSWKTSEIIIFWNTILVTKWTTWNQSLWLKNIIIILILLNACHNPMKLQK
jgi:hypothetical protein